MNEVDHLAISHTIISLGHEIEQLMRYISRNSPFHAKIIILSHAKMFRHMMHSWEEYHQVFIERTCHVDES